ncbi:phospholipase ddhd1 [Plakobranchus ocellatus]|uniref:Phospholipase ddhd1 n=1 Tax=Plakobranchus ocellatus TaxID=259542 RepID=A0AAV3YL30_9GAST|nr:phospholipase ddhd1 [Plakobranchus ocellatus]
MDFHSVADGITMSTSQSSYSASSSSSDGDKQYQSLEGFYKGSDEEEDFDSIALDETPSVSPRLKRYLFPKKEFVEELRPEEVRWFYKNEKSKKWSAFIGYDSLRIECRYRALSLNDDSGDIDLNDKILVRGGLYEVDVLKNLCIPVYWTEDEVQICRGTWFEEGYWQPLPHRYASLIEIEHMLKFKGEKLVDSAPEPHKGSKPVIHNIQFNDFHVDWNASDEIYKYNESVSSKLMRNVRQSLGWQKSGTRLRRGYCIEAVMDDKPPDVCHLVFVIHGIGQKMDTGSIVRCTKDLRQCVKYMSAKMFPEFDQTSKRAEFLPVQWRSSLKLDGDVVESVTPQKMKGVRNILNSSALDILYYTSPLYRSEITNSLKLEILRLYDAFCSRHPYFEPSNGKVSFVAHSLGSVIIYDIITGWNPANSYDELMSSVLSEEEQFASGNSELLSDVKEARAKVHELDDLMTSIRQRQRQAVKSLPFIVENLFALGSPLSVFLALRGIRPQGSGSQEHIVPSSLCKRLFNIFHPSDPVAYRLEPLILKHYSTIMPLHIHHFSDPKKQPYSKIPRRAYAAFTGAIDELRKEKDKVSLKEEDSGGEGETASTDQSGEKQNGADSSGVQVKSQTKFSLSGWLNKRKKREVDEKLSAELQMMNTIGKASEPKCDDDNVSYTSLEDLDKTELEYRLDFQLREQRMENSYLSVLTSHTAYWTNKDVAYFLLTHLHPELQEESCSLPTGSDH